MRHALAALVAVLICTAAPTFAGILDTPIPAPFTKHVYSVSGVNSKESGATVLATLFSCTNVDKKAVTIGVEVFTGGGGAAVESSTGVLAPPGGGVLFATRGVPGFEVDEDVAPVDVVNGSARILSTSKNIICSAILMRADGSSMTDLPMVSKAKQKGD